ncbi:MULTISPECIES: ester cyclase [unclassified Crossiella]|uniref:ester cyclase n=1 Tax=unclassified Crossiella TaxID=2620835 RepID=UPI00200006E6|nr:MULTISPECIES: ester cyclase [unclassified Crossiella]MCK2244746.1 ester cyclase [Crossiella sp. S99.2]MCK2258256.1 ester cyclase [Crossiella sp. S99.1]
MTQRDQQTAATAAVAAAYFADIAARVVDAQLKHYAPDGVGHIHGAVGPTGPAGIAAYFRELYGAFPEWDYRVEEITAEGELATCRWRLTATFLGPGRFQGLRPNGARIRAEGVDLVRVRAGRIVAVAAYSDQATIARQLGVLPPVGSPTERLVRALANFRARWKRIGVSA